MHASKIMLKILQARLQQYVNWEPSDVQDRYKKCRGTRDQIANIHWIIDKERKKKIYFSFIDYAKAFDCVDHNKLKKILNKWEYQTTLPSSWEICMQIKKQQLELDMELQFSSLQSLSRVRLFATPWLRQARPPCPAPTPRVYPNSCPLSWRCHPTISSSVVPFFSRLKSFPASGSFQMSLLFITGGQSIGVSASTSVLPMNTQDWSPLWWTRWISLQSKGLSRVFSNTTVQEHQFFHAQLSF